MNMSACKMGGNSQEVANEYKDRRTIKVIIKEVKIKLETTPS